MVEAISFNNIIELVNLELKNTSKRYVVYDSVDPVSSNAMIEINSKIKKHRIIGVLFCNPNTSFCKNEILGSLNYFHHRSKEKINFFCCGYGAYWPEGHYNDQRNVVEIAGTTWSYSDQAFVNVIEGFESKTKWKYSGENELLLLDVSPALNDNEIFKINSAIVCNLESMKRDGAFTSVQAFFENIISYAGSNECASLFAFSDHKGIDIAKKTIKDGILSFLPKLLQQTYREAENYVIRQI
jgi:hypothetical protein